MIRWYLDTDDDFDVSAGLDITSEIISWRTRRAVHPIDRHEIAGRLEATIRRGRANLNWWREGRLIEGRVHDCVFFRGYLRSADGVGYGETAIEALSWLQFLFWRGENPQVVGESVIDALRRVLDAAAAGLPGARQPSGTVIEAAQGAIVGRRLYWRFSDQPLSWRLPARPLYWRRGPAPVDYQYGRVGDTDTVGEGLLVGPALPAVDGSSTSIVNRLTAVEYSIENHEYGRYIDEIAVLASGERGWIFSGSAPDIRCLGRVESETPASAPLLVMSADYGRYAYTWRIASNAVSQVVGREADVQQSTGVIYRQENITVPAGVSSWRVPLRNRGRPAEATGVLIAAWADQSDINVAASALGGDLLLEVFNNTGSSTRIEWIEVSGNTRVYQGGAYEDRVTGRYGGDSVELRGVFDGVDNAVAYWGQVLSASGPELSSVTLDGRRFPAAWAGELGHLLRSDALAREGLQDGPTDYWIIGILGEGTPEAVTVTYNLMRYGAA